MTHLVIGLGEVGAALQRVLKCEGLDPGKGIKGTMVSYYEMLHICFPYSPEFEAQVNAYKKKFNPKILVIHSTVPIGTSKKLGACHSPIRGKHPKLADSIRTFTKYVGGTQAREVAAEFSKLGLRAYPVKSSDDTEAGKLFDLMQYGISILLNKEIRKYCDAHGLDFDTVYRRFNSSYNAGWVGMAQPQFVRQILEFKPGPIGGHCVVQMMHLLDSPSAKQIIKENEKYGGPKANE